MPASAVAMALPPRCGARRAAYAGTIAHSIPANTPERIRAPRVSAKPVEAAVTALVAAKPSRSERSRVRRGSRRVQAVMGIAVTAAARA
jgi:hypothetical protein